MSSNSQLQGVFDSQLLQKDLDHVQELTEEILSQESTGSNRMLDDPSNPQKLRRQKTADQIDTFKRKEKIIQTLQDEVQHKRSSKIIEDLNRQLVQRDEEIKALKTQQQVTQREFAEYKMQSQFDQHRLEEQIEELKEFVPDEVVKLRSESETLKEQLMQYWKKLSKNLNEEFEEILQMGVSSDASDIMSALLIIQEARQEQENSEKERIAELEKEVQRLGEELQAAQVPPEQCESTDFRRELDSLKQKLQDNVEIRQIVEQQRQMIERLDYGKSLEQRINDLTTQLQLQQQDKSTILGVYQAELSEIRQREKETVKQLQERDSQIQEQQKLIEQLQVRLLSDGAKDRSNKMSIFKQSFQSENVSPDSKQRTHENNGKAFESDRLQPVKQLQRNRVRDSLSGSLQHNRSGSAYENISINKIQSQTQEQNRLQMVQGVHMSMQAPFGGKK